MGKLNMRSKDDTNVDAIDLLIEKRNTTKAARKQTELDVDKLNEKIGKEWSSIIEECRKQIYKLKEDLYGSITEEYKIFTEKLRPPEIGEVSESAVRKIGSQLTQ